MVEPHERYLCRDCDGSGIAPGDAYAPCPTCDGYGETAIDCPMCGREAVPNAETTFPVRGQVVCQTCGDPILALAEEKARHG